MSLAATFAPRRNASRVTSRPMPLPAPVTTRILALSLHAASMYLDRDRPQRLRSGMARELLTIDEIMAILPETPRESRPRPMR